MPKDPIRAINEQKLAFQKQESSLRAEAARGLAMSAPDFIASASDEQKKNALNRSVEILRSRRTGLTADPSAQPGFSPGAAFRSGLSNTMDALPDSIRPESAFGALGLGAVESAAGGEVPRLDDLGNILLIGGSTVGALVPQLRAARAGTQAFGQLGKSALKSVAGSGVGAGVVGPVQQRLESAQALIDEANRLPELPALSRVDAFRKSGDLVSVEAMAARGLAEAMIEAGTSGLGAFGPLAARSGFAKLLGLGEPAVDRMMALAARYKISLGVQDVTNFRIVQRARDTLGKFPAGTGVFTSASKRQAGEVQGAVRDSVGALAPVVRTISESAGSDAQTKRILDANLRSFNRVEGAFGVFRKDVNSLYEGARKAARESGATVGNANTTFRAATARKTLRDLPKEGGKAPLPDGLLKKVDDSLSGLINMDKEPTLEQFINRGKAIGALIDEMPPGSNASRILIEMKKAMEDDIAVNLNAPANVRALFSEADEAYKEGIELFSGQAARRIRRVDRTFGKVRVRDAADGDPSIPNPGTASPGKMISSILNTDDPGVITNLHQILLRGDKSAGQAHFNEVVGVHLENKIRGATKASTKGAAFETTDTSALRRELGLNNTSSDKFQANSEMFRLAGVDLKSFGEVLDLADQFFKEGVPDVSTFISRRAVLGGLGSALRSFSPTQGKFADSAGFPGFLNNVAATAATITFLRGSAKHLTKPEVLRAYRVLLNKKGSDAARLSAMKRLLILDSTFLAVDSLSGGSVSDAQRAVSKSAGDAALFAREAARNVKDQGVIEGLGNSIESLQGTSQ